MTTRAVEPVPGAGIRLAITGGRAEITLARAAQRNTLDSRAFAGLAGALRLIDQDPAVGGVLLTSSVPDVFCSGGTYVDPEHPGRPSPQYAPQLTACFDRWTARRVPVVCVVAGAARAFGAALALTSDLTIATPAASFGLPELSGGVVPSFAIALLCTRYPSRIVRELVLSTEAMGVEQAERRGLVNAVAPDQGAAERLARVLLDRWAQAGPDAVRQAMSTLAEIDAAPDLAAARQIAVAGVEEQLHRFRDGRSNQTYLDT
ncbi:enoyl-CoA hydratase/isomerase family protein [Pseudonocardia sp. TRM90224]|uniref:enoyl-CoA hydratase/isomerase family protein n=1 Tax=Pseudonocardia sp. TRM90224 TaxID=2812678 RepID=UPI001E33170F|nr:enoyl-CoA hydratase/isomerase family protein [Pseudonocardia sp. TRM90224]